MCFLVANLTMKNMGSPNEWMNQPTNQQPGNTPIGAANKFEKM